MSGLSPIQKLLARHPCRNLDEQRQALRQIVQEIALLGLSRTDCYRSDSPTSGGAAVTVPEMRFNYARS